MVLSNHRRAIMTTATVIHAPGVPRPLAVAELASSFGNGAFYACSALYFTRIVGLSATEVGVALTIGWASGMLAGVPLGCLADRWGPRRVAVALAALTSIALAAFLVVRSFPFFVVAAAAYCCCQGGLAAARQALLARLVGPAQRTRIRARLQAVANAGIAVGAALGAAALSFDNPPAYLAVFAMDAASFAVAAVLLCGLPEVVAPRPTETTPVKFAVLRDRRYALITLLNAVMCLNMPLLSLGLPLWIVVRTDAPAAMAAVLLVVNTLGVVLLQVPVARQVTGPRSAARAAGRAGWLMLAACVVYALSGGGTSVMATVAVLLAGAVIQVLGEMMAGAAGWELSFALAPDHQQGQYQGLFSMAPQIARTAGPALLTTLLISWGTVGWLVLGGLFLAAGLAIGPVVRSNDRRQAMLDHGTRSPVGCRPN
jgi:MFS family permease